MHQGYYDGPRMGAYGTGKTVEHEHELIVQNPDAKPELVTTTVKDYDLAEAGKGMKGLFTVRLSSSTFLHVGSICRVKL